MEFTVVEYTDAYGFSPYAHWLKKIRNRHALAKIMIQVDRMSLGLLGDSKPVGNGLSELRIHHGPGYRVYYGKLEKQIILVLCAGDKASQQNDIAAAKAYWKDYRKRHKHGAKHKDHT